MKTTNYGQPFEHKISLRMNDRQWNYVLANCEQLKMSPSEYIRTALDMGMAMQAQYEMNRKDEVVLNEDKPNDINDIV